MVVQYAEACLAFHVVRNNYLHKVGSFPDNLRNSGCSVVSQLCNVNVHKIELR